MASSTRTVERAFTCSFVGGRLAANLLTFMGVSRLTSPRSIASNSIRRVIILVIDAG